MMVGWWGGVGGTQRQWGGGVEAFFFFFVVPRENKTYFGHDRYGLHGRFSHPTVTQEDVDYLLEIINHRFPEAAIQLDDIEASWAGLRPLITANGGSDYNGGELRANFRMKALIKIVQTVDRSVFGRSPQTPASRKGDQTSQRNRLEASSVDPSQVSRAAAWKCSQDGLVDTGRGQDYRLSVNG